jgi:hypothetical protein
MTPRPKLAPISVLTDAANHIEVIGVITPAGLPAYQPRDSRTQADLGPAYPYASTAYLSGLLESKRLAMGLPPPTRA